MSAKYYLVKFETVAVLQVSPSHRGSYC